MGKQSQLLLKPTEVELGLQVGVEFDKNNNHNLNGFWHNWNEPSLKLIIKEKLCLFATLVQLTVFSAVNKMLVTCGLQTYWASLVSRD